MKLAYGLAIVVSFFLFTSLPAVADSPHKSKAVKRLIDETGGQAKVRVDKETGNAKFVRLPKKSMRSPRVNNKAMKSNHRAKEFFREYGDAFGVQNTDSELREIATGRDVAGGEHTVLAQTYEDIPVFGGELRAHFDRDGDLTTVNGNFVAGLKISTTPTLTEEQAVVRATRTVLVQQARKFQLSRRADDLSSTFDEDLYSDLTAGSVDLMAFREGLLQGVSGADHLVYRVEVRNSVGTIREFVFVDAHSSKVVDQITGIYDAKNRRAFDAEGFTRPGPNYPASPFWVEGQPFPTGNVEADNMIHASGETYDLFFNAFGRDSFDGMGAIMDAIFNRGDSCPNASWNGIYISFCPGLTTDDITGHEWAHAYTEYTNNLIYQWQSGALNESYSDIWGETVDLINDRGWDTPGDPRSDGSCSAYQINSGADNSLRWLEGEESSLGALRDMWNPNCAGDPGKVTDGEYHCLTSDSGGVHINSGVPNHAYTLMVDGGTYNGQSVAGIGLNKSAHIQWAAQNMLTPSSNFLDNADALEAACSALIGVDVNDLTTGAPSGEVITAGDCAEVAKAVTAVEMRTVPTQCNFETLLAPDAPALCENLGVTHTIFSEDFEGGSIPAGWTVGSYGIVNPPTFDTPDWAVVGDLPRGNSSDYAAFAEDILLGNCIADIEAGAVYLESPDIVLPPMEVPHVAFDHWVATEAGYDGGNVKVSVNGGAWTLVPGSDYSFNAYNTTLIASPASNNPMAGQEAFSGTDGGSVGGSWGQSQVNLFGLALPGDTVKLSFELGVDGCDGAIGWHVDDVHVYSCSGETLPFCGDGHVDAGERCDDGNNDDGDGCSASCGIEDGWQCSNAPAIGSSNIVGDWSFESGYPNTHWDPLSTYGGLAGFPIYGDPNYANTGDWVVWIGGIPWGVTSSVTQDVTIPATATELTLQTVRGICDDASDTLHVSLDGNDIGSVACSAVDGGFVQQMFPLAGYNDGGSHTLEIGGTVGGTNGTHTNFFVDDVVIESNVNIPAQPSSCSRVIEDLSCNDAPVAFDQGIASSWTVIDNEGTGLIWTDSATALGGDNFTGGTGDAASVSSDGFGPAEFDTELRSNVFSLATADSASVSYLVNYQNFGFLDFLNLDISVDGGSTWVNLLTWNEDHGSLFGTPGEAVSVDLTAYLGEPAVQLRWHYFDPNSGDWDWYAQVDDVALACELSGNLPGRMHGHGEIKDDDKMKYKHKIDLQCAAGAVSKKLDVDWGVKSGKGSKGSKGSKKGKGSKGSKKQKYSFRLTELTSAVCSEQPGLDTGKGRKGSKKPQSDFNTIVGTGIGTLNGEPASIEFRFTDAGKPGKNNDEAEYTITGADGVSVSGKLSGGDHHTH